jgi:hypothetical protein
LLTAAMLDGRDPLGEQKAPRCLQETFKFRANSHMRSDGSRERSAATCHNPLQESWAVTNPVH